MSVAAGKDAITCRDQMRMRSRRYLPLLTASVYTQPLHCQNISLFNGDINVSTQYQRVTDEPWRTRGYRRSTTSVVGVKTPTEELWHQLHGPGGKLRERKQCWNEGE